MAEIQVLKPTEVGFVFRLRSTQVCVDAVSNRPLRLALS